MDGLAPIDNQLPWIMRMQWHDLAFLHWPVSAEQLRPLIPIDLEIDTFDGSAWIGVVPFRMSGIGARGLPLIPGTDAFLELNVRTYVSCKNRPGVWFFSLDAANTLAVLGARLTFALPYFNAFMTLERTNENAPTETIHYTSQRIHRNAASATFRASYGPLPDSTPYQSAPGTLEHWLTERYCLYSFGRNGKLYRGEIIHPPWPLQKGWVSIDENAMTDSLNINLSTTPSLVHFAKSIDVRAWYIVKA